MTVYVDNVNEEWRPVSISPRYQVSNLGRVRGSRGWILRSQPLPAGYRQVKIYTSSVTSQTRLVHCLVAREFLGECPLGHEVNHKDGDPSNNRVSNLEYVTHPANVRHAYRVLGARGARGELSGHSILNVVQVLEIRRRYAEETITTVQLAREYGVRTNVVGNIVRRKTWKHAEVDVVDTKRDEAIRLGAVAIDIRDMGALTSARRRGEIWAPGGAS